MIKIKSIKNRASMTMNYIRDSYWNLDKVYSLFKKNKNKNKYFIINKHKIKTSSHKNSLFMLNYEKNKGKCKCDLCGIEATYIVLEKSNINDSDIYHFNLYTVDKKTKNEIYFNIDHIKPRSKGGKNELSNMQLTCELCNSKKADNHNNLNYYIFKIKKIFKKYLNKIKQLLK